jgi:hypothetical protein
MIDLRHHEEPPETKGLLMFRASRNAERLPGWKPLKQPSGLAWRKRVITGKRGRQAA